MSQIETIHNAPGRSAFDGRPPGIQPRSVMDKPRKTPSDAAPSRSTATGHRSPGATSAIHESGKTVALSLGNTLHNGQEDPLRAATGIGNGLAAGLAFWALAFITYFAVTAPA